MEVSTDSESLGVAGIRGSATGVAGVSHGVWGTTAGGLGSAGVRGEAGSTGLAFGVHGINPSTTTEACGVRGDASSVGTGATFGVRGANVSTTADAAGVQGDATATSGAIFGVRGTNASTTANAAGVQGNANGASGATFGVRGSTASNTNGAIGVVGNAPATSGDVIGVKGTTASSGLNSSGVVGEGTGTGLLTTGVYGISTSGVGLRGQGGRAPLNLFPGATPGAPTAGVHLTGDIYIDSLGSMFLCKSGGVPGTWTVLNNQSTAGAPGLFALAEPVRIYYSLNAGDPPLANTQERSVAVTNGTTIPHAASAVLTNLAVTPAGSDGFLAMFKHGTVWTGTSNLNFTAGEFASNNATSAVAPDADPNLPGKVRIRCGGGTVHFVIDVFGYYP